MYMCMAEAPSSACRGRFSSAGIWLYTPAPTVSMRYFPTNPLPFARPSGKSELFEFRRMRADSQALAARITTGASARSSCRLVRSMYWTPSARPRASTVTSRTMASVTTVRLPVASAGGRHTVGDWKFALIEQPFPHGVAQKQAAREAIDSRVTRLASSLFGHRNRDSRSASCIRVRIARCDGITGMPRPSHVCFVSSSYARGAGGG